jgi:hypothetical protein
MHGKYPLLHGSNDVVVYYTWSNDVEVQCFCIAKEVNFSIGAHELDDICLLLPRFNNHMVLSHDVI